MCVGVRRSSDRVDRQAQLLIISTTVNTHHRVKARREALTPSCAALEDLGCLLRHLVAGQHVPTFSK